MTIKVRERAGRRSGGTWRGMKRNLSGIFAGLLMLAVGACGHAERQQNPRLATAEAMFAERCKKSGEFVHRSVENVEGIFLIKLRPDRINFGDQFLMDDPYGAGIGGIGYVMNFHRGKNKNGSLVDVGEHMKGYRYVEAIDPADGKRYRYTGSMKVVGKKDPSTPNHQVELQRNPSFDLNNYAFLLDKVPAKGEPPRYGVTYDDLSTREDREYWIAGSSLKVIDLKTQEVIAERIGYMMDRGQGNNSGGRSPWLLAASYACPKFPTAPGGIFRMREARDFVEKVLKVKQGD